MNQRRSYVDSGEIAQHVADAQAGALAAPESERAIIGAALSGDQGADELAEMVNAAEFSNRGARAIWSVIQRVARAGQLPDAALVWGELQENKAVNELGGLRYLQEAAMGARVWSVDAHVKIVRDRALRRNVGEVTSKARERLHTDLEVSGFDILAGLQQAAGDLLHQAGPDELYVIGAQEAALQRVDKLDEEARLGKPKGLMTGLHFVDHHLRGLMPGALIVLAGRPSMGKTAVGRGTASHAARKNPDHLFVYFCIEMDREEISDRALSEASYMADRSMGIEYRNMDGSRLDQYQRARLRRHVRDIPENFILDDSPSMSVEYIRRRLYALRKRGKIGAAFIDYLQIMRRPEAKGRNDAVVIQEMTTALKNLARELGIAIVLLSQLNRGVEGREDKRPQLSDLRESGAIEQDANVVLFVYREHYYLSRKEPKGGGTEFEAWQERCKATKRVVEILGPKNRGGATFTQRQAYFAEFDRIEDDPEEQFGALRP